MIPKSGNRFPACAKPYKWFDPRSYATAGEGRSEKIMLKQKSQNKRVAARKAGNNSPSSDGGQATASAQ
jgi:hypothetical protein